MGVLDYYKKCFQQFTDFSGRARRKEYWSFALINMVIILAFYIVMAIIIASSGALTNQSDEALSMGLPTGAIICYVIIMIYSLITLIPNLAVSVRRLHDTGKSGWNLLIGLIPLVGAIIVLVWYFTDSQKGTNRWGPNPKNPGNDLHELGQDPYASQQFNSGGAPNQS